MVLYKYYFQIPVQKEAIRRLTGFSAFNTLWTWLRLSQDIHTASDIAQFVIDWLFERCKTFRWIYGWCLNIQQISRWTLKHRSPMVFCSSECLPMSAFSKKVRVVSKFNASSWTSNRSRLCRLARAKNRRDPNIQVPKHQRSTMVKAMLHVILYACKSKNIPTFSFLRELTKPGGTLQANSTSWETIWRCQRSSIRSCLKDDTHSFLGCELWIFCHSRPQSQSGYLKNCKFIRDKELYIDGCYSKTLSSTFHFYGSWYKEFQALQDIVRKFENLLWGQNFWIMSNNSIVTWWVSMTKVSDKITRKISYLNSFYWKIVYICLKLNPTNTFTRNNPQFEDKKACRTL